MSETKSQIEKLCTAWEEFKKTNDERLETLESKQSVDPLIEEKLEKLNSTLNEAQDRLKAVETKTSRPALNGSAPESKEDPEAEYKQSFFNYIRTGYPDKVLREKKSITIGSNPDGGYAVMPSLETGIRELERETTLIRQYADIRTSGTNSYQLLITTGKPAISWINEGATVTETDTPTLNQVDIPIQKLAAYPFISEEALEDPEENLEQWLQNELAKQFSEAENTTFVTGNGVGKPRGFTDYPTAATSDASRAFGTIEYIPSESATNWTEADTIIKMKYALKQGFRNNSVFFMNSEIIKTIRTFKDGNGQYLWQMGLAAGQPDTLAGRPLLEAPDMDSDVTTGGNIVLALADWSRAYTIVDRRGIRIKRDEVTKPGFVKYYASKRVGGGVTDTNAIKLLKIAAS